MTIDRTPKHIRLRATVTFEYETDPEYYIDVLDDVTPENIAREDALGIEDNPVEFLSMGVVTDVEVVPCEG